MTFCIGAQTIVATLATIAFGEVTPESIRTYTSINLDPRDNNEQIKFKEPVGALGIEYDIHEHVRVFAEHLSSPVQCNDFPGINHVGVKFLAPIDDVTLYSGISINNSDFDSNDNFETPLGNIGLEFGDDFKFYMEYLAGLRDFEHGRGSVGFKVFFK